MNNNLETCKSTNLPLTAQGNSTEAALLQKTEIIIYCRVLAMFLAANNCSNIESFRLGFENTPYMATTHTYLSLNMPLPALTKEQAKHKSANTDDSSIPLMHTPKQLREMRKYI